MINFDKINCYKMKWWTVEIIKQPCFVMYDLYFCHFKTYEKLHSALRHPVYKRNFTKNRMAQFYEDIYGAFRVPFLKIFTDSVRLLISNYSSKYGLPQNLRPFL